MITLTLPRAHFVDVDISSAAHKANPYPLYAKLRAEAPVCEVPMPDGQTAWLVTRYDDVVSVLKDPRFVKDRFPVLSPAQLKQQPWVPSVFKPLMSNMLDNDPPNHTRLRALVQKAFTPRRIEEMRGRIQLMADDLLNSVPRDRPFDLIADYALPLPSIVIAEILGVPAGDRHKFHRWSNTMVSLNWSKWGILRGILAGWQLIRYARKLIAQRRARPADDMISALVQAREDGDALSEDEMVAMIVLLLIAGHETTVNLIGNGLLSLLERPQELQKLRDDPALIVSAVEELLRFSSPLDTATERFAGEDVTIAGVTIPRGSLVFAAISSANRDENQFACPDELDLAREPNRHLSFGLGIHFCLGAPLARAEAQIAINTLLRRAPNLRLAVPPERLKWRQGLVLRGIKSLPLSCV
jgi:cytochrome P450